MTALRLELVFSLLCTSPDSTSSRFGAKGLALQILDDLDAGYEEKVT